MEYMENNIQNAETKEEEMQLIPLIRFCYHTFKYYWKWFVLSIVVCLTIGFLYQQSRPRVYLRQSVMLIEDAQTNGFPGASRKGRGNMSSLLELNGISVGDNLKNEIFILTSFRLMNRVVDSLKLDINYSIYEDLHEVALYKSSPIKVDFKEPHAKNIYEFNVDILDKNTFRLSDMVVTDKEGDEYECEEEWTVKAGEPVMTPAGELTIYAKKKIDSMFLDKPIVVTRVPKRLAATEYHNRLDATEYDKESSLIVLSCKDKNARRAEEVLNEVYSAYKRDVVGNKNRVAQNTLSFIDDRIYLIGSELSAIEKGLADFKENNHIIDFKETAKAYSLESSKAREATIEAETQVEVAKYLQDFLGNHSHATDVIPVLNLEGANFSHQISEYNKLMIERNSWVDNTTSDAQIIVQQDLTLASLRKSILASLDSYVKSMQVRAQEARSYENLLMGKTSNVPSKEREALAIERQQLLKSNLYNFLLNKREEVAMQLAINEANVRIVEDPMGNQRPVSPRRLMIMIFSFIMGVLIPSAVLWARTLFDITVKGRRDIEESTSIPLAGEIPHWDNPEKGGDRNRLITNAPTDSPIAEALRVLRYGLNFMRHNARVFVTTSTTPGQGKSFVSSNLGIVYSMTGKRVLLVDADIRKRTLSKSFGKSAGLTGFLVDDEDKHPLESLIIPNAICEGVDFLPAGMLPPNPAELLMSDRLEKLVEVAKQSYDYVILDSTPMFAVADAGIVSRVADLTLYVIRVGVQERDFLPELEKMHQSKRLRNLCIVLNDADVKGRRYGYGYGYGYKDEDKNENGGKKGLFKHS